MSPSDASRTLLIACLLCALSTVTGATAAAKTAPLSASRAASSAPPGAANGAAGPGLGALVKRPGDPTGTASPPQAVPAGSSPPTSDPSAQAGAIDGSGSLTSNGFGSPECGSVPRLSALGAQAAADCAASGISTAPAPLEHYAFDIHIDTGPTKIDKSILSVVQSVLLGSLWTALIWLVHVVIVALQWCYSFDLLGPGTGGPVAAGLGGARHAITDPWLGCLLALAGIALAYQGLVRRRIAESLGQALLMLAMMAVGLWIIANPQGTVGRIHDLANTASGATVGAIATGDGAQPERGLRDSLAGVFETAVRDPWCYMEFGDVDWCRDPRRLSPGLRAEALRIVAIDRAVAACRSGSVAGLPADLCAAHDPLARRELLAQAAALESADTNGELFLALPADSPPRNSIHADGANPSLLHALCGADDLSACSAAGAPIATFRTEAGTWPRAGGLLLIAVGTSGMLLLFGFIAMRLLGASLLSVVFLLLAPVAVLTPALGESGREAFRRWAARLLGAVLAKLVYSVLLGVLLLAVHVLEGFTFLGWWTQWLLTGAFWWLSFVNRHKLLEHVIVGRSPGERSRANFSARHLARSAGGVLGVGGRIRLPPPPGAPLPQPRSPPPPRLPRDLERLPHDRRTAEQVSRSLAADHASALGLVAQAPVIETRIAGLEARGERLREQRQFAARSGHRRRAVSLALREEEVVAQARDQQIELDGARSLAAAGDLRGPRGRFAAPQLKQREVLLDRQAGLRPLLPRAGDSRTGERDYASLASLAGSSPREWREMSAPARRVAKLRIDRELDLRRSAPATMAREPRRVEPDQLPPRPEALRISRRGRQFARRYRSEGP